jgi:hypothetical protein
VTVRHDRWPGHDRDERQTVGLGPRAGRCPRARQPISPARPVAEAEILW